MCVFVCELKTGSSMWPVLASTFDTCVCIRREILSRKHYCFPLTAAGEAQRGKEGGFT